MSLQEGKTRNVFLSGNKRDMLYMLDYLKNNCEIEDADYWNYIGYWVIQVPKEQQEYALKEGKKFAVEEDFGMYWVDEYNVRRAPICSYDIGYGLLPKERMIGESKKTKTDNRFFWSEDEYTPYRLRKYLEAMRDYLMVEKIYRSYNFGDDALILASQSLEYNEQVNLLRKFVKENGYGPFREIHTLSFTGKYRKNPIRIKSIKDK